MTEQEVWLRVYCAAVGGMAHLTCAEELSSKRADNAVDALGRAAGMPMTSVPEETP